MARSEQVLAMTTFLGEEDISIGAAVSIDVGMLIGNSATQRAFNRRVQTETYSAQAAIKTIYYPPISGITTRKIRETNYKHYTRNAISYRYKVFGCIDRIGPFQPNLDQAPFDALFIANPILEEDGRHSSVLSGNFSAENFAVAALAEIVALRLIREQDLPDN
jgi:hypothetical protein